MIKKLLPALFSVMLLMWGAGCSDNPSDSGSVSGELNLVDEFGGYTDKVESEGFGDEDLLQEASQDEEYNDVMLLAPGVDSLVDDPDVGYYHFRAVWGQMCYDSTVIEPTDWSGSLTISRGAEIIRKVIRFELGQDYILERYDRRIIEWHSITTVHNDGISVDLFVPPVMPEFDTLLTPEIDTLGDTAWVEVIDTTYPETEPVTVTFQTGPYSRTFTMDELMALDTIVYMEDSSAVAFHALKLDRIPCPRGFLAGVWGIDEEGNQVFRGTWMNHRGNITGYLKGHYGVNEDGMKVLFGKWITTSGEFEGFIKGTYGYQPNDHANGNAFRKGHGWFRAMICNANSEEIGILNGKFQSNNEHNNGFFQGRWKLRCNDLGADTSDSEDGF